MRLLLVFGLSFELPLALMFFARVGFVTKAQLIGFWRQAVVVIFVFAAFVTPTTDPATLTFLAAPMVILYVLSIFLAGLVEKRRDCRSSPLIMDFESLLRDIRSREGYAGQIHNLSALPARAAQYTDLGLELHPTVQSILDGLGIERLYAHQVEAIEASLSGEDVVVVSGTASGKSWFIPRRRWPRTSSANSASSARARRSMPRRTTATPRATSAAASSASARWC